jgi:hypothetical protein
MLGQHFLPCRIGREYTEAEIRAMRLSPLVGRSVMFAVESKTGRNGGLAPTSLPLFQGLRGAGLSAAGD